MSKQRLGSKFWIAAAAALATSYGGLTHAAEDPYALFGSLPPPPANVAAAGAATQLNGSASPVALIAPAYANLQSKISAQSTSLAVPSGAAAAAGGIDFARAGNDAAYAAQIQQQLQSMSPADRMAWAQQMAAAHTPTPTASGGAVAFLAQQRSADQLAQQKMRALLDGALNAAAARHKAADAEFDAAAKNCTTDKTGWPLDSCTGALGDKSIAQHRAIEEAVLPAENKAFSDALALAHVELNKGRSVQGGSQSGPFAAWVLIYVQLLRDYGEAITLRSGFWAHASGHKYTGHVTVYAGSPDLGVAWPLQQPLLARTGL
jgi:hypothetical protein